MRIATFVLCALLAAACGSPASRADRAQAIEAQLWSPYCPGRLLIDCTTDQARELRAQIRDRIDRGQSPDVVIAWLRSEFGSEAMARPDATGRGLIVWLVPAAIFAAGTAAVVRTVRRWRRASAAA